MHKFKADKAQKLLNPVREKILPVREVLDKLAPVPGERFADIGCGPGYFTLPLARLLGEQGKVFAVDIASEMLNLLKERAAEAGVDNIEYVCSSETAVTLPDNSVEGILIVNVFHEIPAEQRGDFLKEMKRIAKDSGRIYIVDWDTKRSNYGPPQEERVSRQAVVDGLQAEGIEAAAVQTAGVDHYLVAGRCGRLPEGK